MKTVAAKRLAVRVMAAATLLAAVAAYGEDAGSPGTVTIVGVTPLPGADAQIGAVAAPVQTAEARAIEASHALDLAAFLNRMSGSVHVNDIQNNPLQPDVNFRGYTASPLLGTPQGLSVYLDGVRLNQPFGDVVSWDLIPRQAIATLSLMPGSNPLFGLNTLGGALSLRTKDGYSSPGVKVGLGYGSHDRRSVEAEIGGHAAHGLYWYGTANRLEEDGWRAASPTSATQAFGKLGFRSDHGDAALNVSYSDSDLTGNGLQDLQLLESDHASIYTKPDVTQNESYLLNLVATHATGEALKLSGNLFYRRIRTATLNGDINDDSLGEALYQPSAAERAALAAGGYSGFPLSGETQDNTPFPSWRCIANILLNSEPNEKCNGLNNRTRTAQHDTGLTAQATFSGAIGTRRNQLTLGIAQVSSTAHFTQSSQFGYLGPDRGVVTVAGPGAFADGTQDSENAFDARVDLTGETTTQSVFLADTVHLGPGLQLTLSGRFDRTEVDNLDALIPEGEPGSLTAAHHFSRFNPAAGMTVGRGKLGAYFGYNEGSRAPSAIELGCADPDNPCRLPNAMAGDPPLLQVITRTLEAGVRGDLAQRLSWNAGVFRAENRNDIMFVASEQTGFGYFRNFGRTRRQGAEAGIRARFGDFDFGANYAYLDATYRSPEEVAGEGNSSNEEGAGFEGTIDIEPGDRIPLTPRHLFKAQVGWQVAARLALDADLISISGSFARGNENNEHEADGTYYLGSGRTSGYVVVNFGVEFLPAPSLKLFAQVNNVFDREYFTASQLAVTGFSAAGNFVARPFAGPIVDGERPLLGSTFLAPGTPRSFWLGVRYAFNGASVE